MGIDELAQEISSQSYRAELYEIARRNLETRFSGYIGRPIIVGKNDEGIKQQFGGITSRSEHNQNREYVIEDDINGEKMLMTVPHDASKMEDPSLLIYKAMRSKGPYHIVSNGDQTDTVHSEINISDGMAEVDLFCGLNDRYCENDEPTFTLRETGLIDAQSNLAHISILKVDPIDRAKWIRDCRNGLDVNKFPTVRQLFGIPLHEGFGWCVNTYENDNSKYLTPFKGEPFIIPLEGSVENTNKDIWKRLDPEHRIAFAGKEIFEDGKYRFARPLNMHLGD